MLAAIDLEPSGAPGARGYEFQKRLFDHGLHLKATGDCVIVAPPLIAEPVARGRDRRHRAADAADALTPLGRGAGCCAATTRGAPGTLPGAPSVGARLTTPVPLATLPPWSRVRTSRSSSSGRGSTSRWSRPSSTPATASRCRSRSPARSPATSIPRWSVRTRGSARRPTRPGSTSRGCRSTTRPTTRRPRDGARRNWRARATWRH